MNCHDEGKNQALVNLKKARSLIDTMIGMVESGKYCVDIMQQNLAVIGLLRSAHEKLMDNHLKTCFVSAMSSKSEKKKEDMIDEIQKLMKMGNK